MNKLAIVCIIVLTTILAAIAPSCAEAVFELSNLTISPQEVETGQSATISVDITNTGAEGTCPVILKIDGVQTDIQNVTVGPGATQQASFTVTREDVGSYTVEINGLAATLKVLKSAEFKTVHIDYGNPELYLASGTQSSLNEKYSNEIGTQIRIENNDMKGVAEIFRWKQGYFRTYSAGGKLVGKTTINQIMEEKALSGCHDHGLVLVSVFRKYGFPAIMVDTAGIQWAWDYSKGEQEGFMGHVFVEVYVNNNWILINSTSGEYVENYDPCNPVIPMTSSDEGKGYFALLKGLDPEDYGITSIQQLKEHLKAFAKGVKPVDMYFPQYEIRRLP